MAHARILIVEDESIVALDVENRLQRLGYEIVGIVSSGEDAIRRVKEVSPELVLMDIMLRGEMDGIQAAEVIREGHDIPVIFLTAYADENTLQRAKISQPFGYILKPFEERELHSAIEMAFYRHEIERKLRESEERYSLAALGANDGLWDWNLKTDEIYFSPRWKSMIGAQEQEVGTSPKEWFERLHPDDEHRVRDELARHISGVTPHFESEYRIMRKDGTYRWMLSRGLAVRTPDGAAYRMAGSQTDVTERRVYDALTGLPNRTLLLDRLEVAIERSRRNPDYSFAVLVLDLETFKRVNDTLGHSSGDQLLIQVARRLEKCIFARDTAARLEADEFTILLDEIRSLGDATRVAKRLQSALEQPFEVNGQEVYTRASIGIVIANSGYTRPEDLIRDANAAASRAILSDSSRCEVFDPNMHACAVARLQLECDLRKAVEQSQFQVYYQPIISLSNGRIEGFEALLRWNHPSKGILSPIDFIPLAEETGLIIPIGMSVLEGACRQMKEWQLRFPAFPKLTVSVNLSARNFAQEDLTKFIINMLDETEMDPATLKLEITESVLMDNFECASSILEKLQGLRVQFHMDDFGTGYSSLSYLHRFPVQTLKIDRSFVSNMCFNEQNFEIVRTIVLLGHNLGIEVTAEGVETAQQLLRLKALKCDFGQGFFFSRPLTADDAEKFIARFCDLLDRDERQNAGALQPVGINGGERERWIELIQNPSSNVWTS